MIRHDNIAKKRIDNNYAALMTRLKAELKKAPCANRKRLRGLVKHLYLAGICEGEDVGWLEPFYDYQGNEILRGCDILKLARVIAGEVDNET